MIKNIIYVKSKEVKIKRDKNGSVIRITSEAADILENLLSQVPVGGDLSICRLASNLIEYGADNTIIKVNGEED